MNRDIFTKMSSWSQLLFLCLFVVLGSILLSIIAALSIGLSPQLVNQAGFMRCLIVVQDLFLFLLPAIFCAFLFQERGCHFLKIDKKFDWKALILVSILIFSVQPFVNVINHYNQQIELPSSMAAIQEWIKTTENSAQALINKLISTENSLSIFLVNIFLFAIVAGICEEFFFRGIMQQLFNKITRNHHLAIWITAIIFSFIHFQFYGFFSRMFLGALLGYVYVWTGNLWMSISVHALNNALGVTLAWLIKDSDKRLDSFGLGHTFYITIIGLVIAIALVFFLLKYYQRSKILEY